MKTKYTIAFLLSCFVTVLYGQQNDNFMSISMGASIPLDDFASTIIDNEKAGYAQTSFGLGFDGAYLFTNNLGLGATISFANNSVATTELRDDLVQKIKEDYPDLVIPDGTEISFDVGAWNHINLMIGPHFTLPANQVSLDLRALAGFCFVLPPDFQIYVSTPEEDIRRYSDIKRSANFGYLLGGGFRYSTHAGYMIRLMVDYSNATARMKVTDQIIDDNQTTDQEPLTIDQPVGAIFAGIGLGYHF